MALKYYIKADSYKKMQNYFSLDSLGSNNNKNVKIIFAEVYGLRWSSILKTKVGV